MNRLAYIDGLRGLFALMIALYHFNKTVFFPGGYLAVDFFFVLSGFILAYVYLPRLHKITLTQFIGARLSRLWPLHIFTMFLLIAAYSLSTFLATGELSVFPDWSGESRLGSFFENVFLLQNAGVQNGLTWNYPSWSISVEFWVNICLFFVLMGLVKRPNKQTGILAALTFIVLLCYVILEHEIGSFAGTRAHTDQIAIILNTGMMRGFAGIFLGVLVCKFVSSVDSGMTRWTSKLWGWGVKSCLEIGLLYVIIYIIAIDGVNNDVDYIAVLLFAILLAVLSIGQHSLLRQVLSIKPFTFLGLISYSIYLGHMPLLQVFRKWTEIFGPTWNYALVLGLFLTSMIGLGTILYYCIEKPGQALFKRAWDIVFTPNAPEVTQR